MIGIYLILSPFLTSLVWAAILVTATWPVYRRLRERVGRNTAAFVMTLLLIVLVVAPAVLVSWAIAHEAAFLYKGFQDWLTSPRPELPGWLKAIPAVGDRIEGLVQELWEDPERLKIWFGEGVDRWSDEIIGLVGNVGRNVGRGFVALFVAFFVYRHGDELVEQTRRVFAKFVGEPRWPLVRATSETVRAVVYGLLLTALAQGTLAGLGYWVAGVPAPALLGAATVLLALFPFGAPVVWLPISLWLMAQGSLAAGVGLLLWGALVVSTIDNLIRPLVISRAIKIPFLLVFFSVIGGVVAFGLAGLFLGPILLSAGVAIWREWTEEQETESRGDGETGTT